MKTRSRTTQMRKWATLATAAVLFTVSACFLEQEGVLLFSEVVPPPDTTSATQVTISGRVVRSPQRAAPVSTITVTGGMETATKIEEGFGLFTIAVELKLQQENVLVMSASDDTGAVTQDSLTFVVVQN